jgi:hypothetical protein
LRFLVTFSYRNRLTNPLELSVLIEAVDQEAAERGASVLVNYGRQRLDWRVLESRETQRGPI